MFGHSQAGQSDLRQLIKLSQRKVAGRGLTMKGELQLSLASQASISSVRDRQATRTSA